MDKIKKIDFLLIITILVIIVGIIIRLKLFFLNQSFWFDECSLGANLISKNYLDFFKPLDSYQVAPPFFMILSKFILNISNQVNDFYTRDLVLRIFPCFCSILSIPLFTYLIHKMFKNKYMTLSTTLMFSLNDIAINYAQEFKQYSCELLFSVILILIFYLIDIEKISIKKLSFYSIFFIIAPWFSYSSIIIIFTGFFIIFLNCLRKKYFDKTKLLILFLPSIINILIFYFGYYLQIHTSHYEYMKSYWNNNVPSFLSFSNFFIMFREKLYFLIKFVFPEETYLFLTISVLMLLLNKNNTFKIKILALMPISIVILMSFLNMYPWNKRLLLFLLPCFIIIYCQMILFIKPNKLLTMVLIYIAIFSSSSAYTAGINHIQHKSAYRELAIQLKKLNPTFKNVFFLTSEQSKYYIDEKYITKEFRNINIKEAENMLETKFKNIPVGNYWIEYFYGLNTKNGKELKKYLDYNHNLKIISIWKAPLDSAPGFIYIRKVKEY